MKKLNREELIELVSKIQLGEGDDEFDQWIIQIRHSVPHPEVLNVITRNKEGLSVDQIVDKLLNYQPIILPPVSRD